MSNPMSASDIETATVRKLQARIIPFIFVLMIIAYLDRVNIGFAALTMNKELAITSQQFGLISGLFFFGYLASKEHAQNGVRREVPLTPGGARRTLCAFEIPSNLMLQRIGARIWIARILLSWGIVAVLTSLAQTAAQLYVARFLLGVAEAGFFPGIVLYLTSWFSPAPSGPGHSLVSDRSSRINYYRSASLGPDPRSRSLARCEQLALVAGLGGPPCRSRWCFHLPFASLRTR